MSSYTSHENSMSREEAWDLIPWYVKGTLEEEERAAVEARIAIDPELRAEVAMQRRLAEQIGSLDALGSGLERSLAATRQRIEAETQGQSQSETAAASSAAEKPSSALGWLREHIRLDLRVLLPATAMAAALALFLVLPSLQPTEQGTFRTLTDPAVVSEAAQLRVKVAEGVTEL